MVEQQQPIISYCTPVLNEEIFLPFYLENLTYSTIPVELVITDGGSTDKTVELIEEFTIAHPDIHINFKYAPQEGKPYTDDWNEHEVRNDLLQRCKGQFIVLADSDEIIEPKDVKQIITEMNINKHTLAYMKFIPFWETLKKVRLNGLTDPRWFGLEIGRIIKNNCYEYNNKAHHCGLIPIIDHISTSKFNYPVYHLHYGFGQAGLKPGDNRRAELLDPELNISMYAVPDIIDNPDFSDKCWTTDVGWILNVKTEEWKGPWPKCLTHLIN